MLIKGVGGAGLQSNGQEAQAREEPAEVTAEKTDAVFKVPASVPSKRSEVPSLKLAPSPFPVETVLPVIASVLTQASRPLGQEFSSLQAPAVLKSQATPSTEKEVYCKESFSNLVLYLEKRKGEGKEISFVQFPLIVKDDKGTSLSKEEAKSILDFLRNDYSDRYQQWPFIVRETSNPNQIGVEFMIEAGFIHTQCFDLFINANGQWKILMQDIDKQDHYYDLKEWTAHFSGLCEVRPLDLGNDVDWDRFHKEKSK